MKAWGGHALARTTAVSLLALCAWVAACKILPTGDDNLPSTKPLGIDPPATLALIVAPGDRTGRSAVPVNVEVRLAMEDAGDGPFCVALTGKPGRLVMPFASACEADAAVVAEGGTSSVPTADSGAADFVKSTGCVGVSKQDDGSLYGRTLAAYVLAANEPTASLFGALYPNALCSGEPIATNSLVLSLVIATADAGSDAAPDTGGEAGVDASSEAGGPGDATTDGALDGAQQDAADAAQDASGDGS